MNKITKETIIMDVLMMDRETAPIFFRHGMHCIGCPSASGESIEDACAVHGIDADKLVADLNAHFEVKG
jgi:hybrid cluster-associated redox disulfide protein